MVSQCRRLPAVTKLAWFPEWLDHAIRVSKLNPSAGLSARDTMAFHVFYHALAVVEVAANDESLHKTLIESDVTDVLEYNILNDFSFDGSSGLAMHASGAAVALVGRNEGGKVLPQEAVHAVLDRLRAFFDPQDLRFVNPASNVVSPCSRVAVMAISDANKKHMLRYKSLLDLMLKCLVVDADNHLKGQDGADVLQETSAGVLHELSLFGPGADAMRSHADMVPTLRKVCEIGTKASKDRSAATLFELIHEGLKKAATATVVHEKGTGLPTQSKPPPHVMVSYNWDHQDIILRVVESLQDRGYLVWVDTEQMKGATVDTMALAVEGSAVVLVGVSHA